MSGYGLVPAIEVGCPAQPKPDDHGRNRLGSRKLSQTLSLRARPAKIKPWQAFVILQSALRLNGADARALHSRSIRHEPGLDAPDLKYLLNPIIMPDGL